MKHDGQPLRVGVLSPNLLMNIRNYNAMSDDPRSPWMFDEAAKRTALLFDKIFVTDDFELTCKVLGSTGLGEEDPCCVTFRYLIERGVILTPRDLGYGSAKSFLMANIRGAAVEVQKQLAKVGNPSNNCMPGETTYVGQPDITDFEAHDGNHPRSSKGWNDPAIERKKRKYETLLLARNAAVLRHAGIEDVTVVGRLLEHPKQTACPHPVWKILFQEMPTLDIRASWDDVLCFRQEARTQHFSRSLRRWLKKVVAESWTSAELEDEIRELIYEYERHLQRARLNGNSGLMEFAITGMSELAEDLVKLRFAKIGKLVSGTLNRRAKLLQEEDKAPGRELALVTEMKRRF